MDHGIGRDVIRRWAGNPLITVEDLRFQCSDICNAGVVRHNGEYILLVTVEALEGHCSLYLARSKNGQQFWMEEEPFMVREPTEPFGRAESFGVRDARITPMDGGYYIAYLAQGDDGFRVGLARTEDFQSVQRIAMVSEPDCKSGAMFGRKIAGRYAILTRPEQGESIWVQYSDDLIYWGSASVVISPRGGFWDADRIGAAGPPIEIEEGWLLIYYGEKRTSGGLVCRLGVVLLDRDDPSKVISRSNVPILSPREHYERIGDVGNLVFSCGAVLLEGGLLRLYYGGSDSCICLGTATLEEILQACVESEKEY